MNDGGPAFPCFAPVAGQPMDVPIPHGMTLLDWFAGQAMIALVRSNLSRIATDMAYTTSDIACLAYKQAIAMLEERNRITAQATPASDPSLPER